MMPEVLFCFADWDARCAEFREIVKAVCKKYEINYNEANDNSEDFKAHRVVSVPTTLFIKEKTEVGRITGFDVPALKTFAERLHQDKLNLERKLRALIGKEKVMVFIKGTPEDPKCKFTRALLELFKEHHVNDFGYFNILSDEEVRIGT